MKHYQTKKLGECLEKVPTIKGINTKQYLKEGLYPIIDQGQEFIGGFTNDESFIYKGKLPVVIFGDHTRIFKYIDFHFALGADGTKILLPKENIDPRFFYFVLLSLDIKTRGYARHYRILREKEIPLPPIEIQKKIVERIEKLMGKIDEAKKLRKEAMADASSLIPSALNKIFEEGKKKEWKEKTIGDLCIVNPRADTKNLAKDMEVSFVPMKAVDEKDGIIKIHETRKLSEVAKGYTYFANNDVLFAKITPCMENGKSAIAKNLKNGIGFGSTEFHVLRTKGEILSELIHYHLRQKSFRDEAQNKMTGSAGQKRVPKDFIEKTKIPLPPLPEQQKIVEYLDSLSEKVRKIQTLQLTTERELKLLEKSVLNKAFVV